MDVGRGQVEPLGGLISRGRVTNTNHHHVPLFSFASARFRLTESTIPELTAEPDDPRTRKPDPGGRLAPAVSEPWERRLSRCGHSMACGDIMRSRSDWFGGGICEDTR